jgi:anti-anti-sigma regulatory factor
MGATGGVDMGGQFDPTYAGRGGRHGAAPHVVRDQRGRTGPTCSVLYPMVRWELEGRGGVGEVERSSMNDEFSVEVEHMSLVALVLLRGVLDAFTAPDLRAALLECLAEQPAGVIVDASELSIRDDVGLTVLSSVAQQSEQWPGTRFAVVAPTHELAAVFVRMGTNRYMLICTDRDAAFLELSRGPLPPWSRHRISPGRDAPGIARAAVQAFLEEHGVGDGDAAQLVASELVTNAVVHAGTLIDLTLRLTPPFLQIAVRDSGAGHVRIKAIVDESSESGRGLLLVDALAAAWGSLVSKSGKIVWARVRVNSAVRGRRTGP